MHAPVNQSTSDDLVVRHVLDVVAFKHPDRCPILKPGAFIKHGCHGREAPARGLDSTICVEQLRTQRADV